MLRRLESRKVTRSSATAEKQRVSCACIYLGWLTDRAAAILELIVLEIAPFDPSLSGLKATTYVRQAWGPLSAL